MKAKFKKGDVVEIVGYGSIIWVNKSSQMAEFFDTLKAYDENEKTYYFDIDPEIVGKTGVVDSVSLNENYSSPQYSLSGVSKVAWYNEEQLSPSNKQEESHNSK